jgi:hypothetical protein
MLRFSSELPAMSADTNILLAQQAGDSWIVPTFIHGTYSAYHFHGMCIIYVMWLQQHTSISQFQNYSVTEVSSF